MFLNNQNVVFESSSLFFGRKRAWSRITLVALLSFLVGRFSERAGAQESPGRQAAGEQYLSVLSELSSQPSGDQAASQTPSSSTAVLPDAPVPPKPVAIYNLLQRKSIVFPNIATNTTALSPWQKFQLFVDNTVSVNSLTWAALGAAVGQADNTPSGYGQEWGGYGKRYGADMARTASSEFFGTFVLASSLHEDPRFFPEIRPPFFHAIKYSIKRIFVTRSDDGREIFNYSGLIGPAMAEGLANVYLPERNRSAGYTFFRYGLDLSSRASGNMFREYWPVLLQKISRPPKPGASH
jgi:hypothetical protein